MSPHRIYWDVIFLFTSFRPWSWPTTVNFARRNFLDEIHGIRNIYTSCAIAQCERYLTVISNIIIYGTFRKLRFIWKFCANRKKRIVGYYVMCMRAKIQFTRLKLCNECKDFVNPITWDGTNGCHSKWICFNGMKSLFFDITNSREMEYAWVNVYSEHQLSKRHDVIKAIFINASKWILVYE